MQKHLLDSKRLRRVPSHFSWVDHRLIRHRLLCGVDSPGWALYLFLVTVGDEQGLSYYSDPSICSHLNLSPEGLSEARRQLLDCRLIAWQSPLYQVLCIETSHTASDSRSGGGDTTLSVQAGCKTGLDKAPALSAQDGQRQSLRLAEALSEIMKGAQQ